jgi:hypothetical protein
MVPRGIYIAGAAISLMAVLSSAEARDARTKATQACQAFTRANEARCQVERCPCGPGERRIAKFRRGGVRVGLCSCINISAVQAVHRRKANAACRDYRARFGKACKVESGNCGPGWTRIKVFGHGFRTKFTACRDKRTAERIKKLGNAAAVLRRPEMLALYRTMFKRIRFKADRPTPLPAATISTLQQSFRARDLRQVRIAHTRSKFLSGGSCIVDCRIIYCRNRNMVRRARGIGMAAGVPPRISDLLLHEIEHTAQCARWGGRNRYALKWFRHLPIGILRAMKRGDGGFLDRQHDRMPLEAKAERKAQRLCPTLCNGPP